MTPYYPTLPDGTKVCKRGHKYDCNLKACPECLSANYKHWTDANRARLRLYWKEYDAKRAGTPARKWKEPESSRQKRHKRYWDNREEYSRRSKDHYRRKPERAIWNGMIHRCTDPSRLGYENYGGRGITVSELWLGDEGFKRFLAEVGPRPGPEYTIDRIDSNGNYEPGNCRWATRGDQARNKRNSRIIEFNGKSQCLKDWALEIGITPSTLKARLDFMKWPLEKALTTPKRKPIYEKALFVEP